MHKIYLRYCANHTKYHAQHLKVNGGFLLNFPNDIQQSSLLDIYNDLDKQWVLIYNKYVIDGARLMINISHEARSKCMFDIENISKMDENEKLKMYDECLAQVHELLCGSYFRYQRSLTENSTVYQSIILTKQLSEARV